MTKLEVFIVSRIPPKKKKKRRDHLAVGEDTGWRSAAGLVPELPLLLATMDTKALPDTETSC